MNDDQTEFNLEFSYSQPNKNGAFRNVRHRQPVTSTRRESCLRVLVPSSVACYRCGSLALHAGGSETVQRLDTGPLLSMYPDAMHNATDT